MTGVEDAMQSDGDGNLLVLQFGAKEIQCVDHDCKSLLEIGVATIQNNFKADTTASFEDASGASVCDKSTNGNGKSKQEADCNSILEAGVATIQNRFIQGD